MPEETIRKAVSDIQESGLLNNNYGETQTRKLFVDRLLRAAGWNDTQPSEVMAEYVVGNDPVDYALAPDSQNMVFIEAKKVTQNLTPTHVNQLRRYCLQTPVNLAVLTNGREWWFYLPMYNESSKNFRDNRFFSIDIQNANLANVERDFKKYLSKENVLGGQAAEAATKKLDGEHRKEQEQQGMVEAWNQIVAEPPEELIKLVRDLTKENCNILPGQQMVRDFLEMHRQQLRVLTHTADSQTGDNPINGPVKKGKVSWSFQSEENVAASWGYVLVGLCERLYEEHKDDFERVLTIRGRDRAYFSMSQSDITNGAKQIGSTGYYVATHFGADQMTKLCYQVVGLFGYPKDSFTVEAP